MIIENLCGTIHFILTLEADNIHIIKWWVDGDYDVHPGMKIHTGAMMSLGKGSYYNASLKQKINTNILTETEVVSVNSRVPTTGRHGSSFHRICPKTQSHPRCLSVVRRRNY